MLMKEGREKLNIDIQHIIKTILKLRSYYEYYYISNHQN